MWMSKLKPQSEARVLLVAVLVTLGFALAALVLAAKAGTVFALPNGRIFTIIGVHSWMPVILALIITIGFQLRRGLLTKRELWRRLVVDSALILLLSLTFYLHFHIKSWVPLLNPATYDDGYWQIDQTLAPLTQASLMLRDVLQRIPYFDQFYQLGYIVVLVGSFMLIAYESRRLFYRFTLAFILTVSLGGLSYLLAPALGPFLYQAGVNAEASDAQQGLLEWHEALRSQPLAWVNEHMADYFGASLAAMPSLHVAYCFLLTYAIWQLYRITLIRVVYALFFVLVICESVWSKWHYWIDAPAGIALALLSLWLARKMIGEAADGKN